VAIREVATTRGASSFASLRFFVLAVVLLLAASPLFAATFTVDTTSDTVDANIGNGTCADASNKCSLRAAIQEANATVGGPHTINVPAGTYTLTITGRDENASATGDLDIGKNMTIAGAGADKTIIDANYIDRVFHVFYGLSVTFQDLAIEHGQPSASGGTVDYFEGGGIFTRGNVTLLRCDVNTNRAGDGIGTEGGGLYVINGTVSIRDSTFRNNFGALRGAGLSNFCTNVYIVNSTFSGNTAQAQGLNSPTGGAIANTCGSSATYLYNVTVADNSATGGYGGAIYNGVSGTVQLQNTIVADNSATSGPDIYGGATSSGYNMIGDTTGATVTAATGDVFNPASSGLSSLANNGGSTMTQAISASSPAFDGGNPAGCKDQSATTITTDQRGTSRPQAAQCDMGAFEQAVFPKADLTISKTGGSTAVAGSTVTYNYSIDNAGPDDATGVTVTEAPPAGMTFSSGTGGCSSGFPWTIGAVAVSDPPVTCTATFALASSLTAGNIVNTASVSGDSYDPNSPNSSSSATTTVSRQVDYTVTVAESADPITAGYPGTGNLVYTVSIKNNGPSDGSGVSVTNTLTLPSGVSVASTSADQGSYSSPTWTVGSLASGQTAKLTVTLTVDSTTAIGTDVITDAASIASSSETRINTSDDSDSESTSVVSPADVSATKSVGGTLQAGGYGTVVYTVVLTNSGNGAQLDNAGDEFTDVLPSELILVDATADSGTATATVATNTVTWNGTIPPSGTVTITINALIKVDTPVGVTVSNQGSVSYDADGNGTNESSADTQAPGGGATSFAVLPSPAVPTLDLFGLGLLGLLLGLCGVALTRR